MDKIWTICYSATGNTEKTVRTIGEALSGELGIPVEHLGFTLPAEREKEYNFTSSDLVVVGTPVYAGKMPNKLLPDFQSRLRGNGALAVAIVTFGNRSYDNALSELCAVLQTDGFSAVAAAAFVGRHAFTDRLAYGRPGFSDQQEMKDFAKKMTVKLNTYTEDAPLLAVPGDPDAPYYVPKGIDGQPAKFLKAKPRTDPSKCSGCGACARLCPMGAIDPENVFEVPGTCIKCQRCIRRCTRGAKYFDDPAFLSHVAMLEQNFEEPKENELFL